MKERRVFFSELERLAIRDGSKTVFRRDARIVHVDGHPQDPRIKIATMLNGKQFWINSQLDHPFHINKACPFGQPGDRIWVPEAFRIYDCSEECACYDQCTCAAMDGKLIYHDDGDDGSKWFPASRMQKNQSRILLEIVSVRVERLQCISKEDTIAEGIMDLSTEDHTLFGLSCLDLFAQHPVRTFQLLWESINGLGSWDANPWVWVVEVKRV